jgi:hypothetical protein
LQQAGDGIENRALAAGLKRVMPKGRSLRVGQLCHWKMLAISVYEEDFAAYICAL